MAALAQHLLNEVREYIVQFPDETIQVMMSVLSTFACLRAWVDFSRDILGRECPTICEFIDDASELLPQLAGAVQLKDGCFLRPSAASDAMDQAVKEAETLVAQEKKRLPSYMGPWIAGLGKEDATRYAQITEAALHYLEPFQTDVWTNYLVDISIAIEFSKQRAQQEVQQGAPP